MWEISVADQSVTFLLSIALGGLLCLIYDVFRSIRKAKNFSAVIVFFQDVAFFAISAILTFVFLLATTAGVLRVYILIGILIGAVLMRLTFSRLFFLILTFVLKLVVKYLGAFREKFYRTGDRIFALLMKISKKTLNRAKKIPFLFKKGLKHKGKVVYTNLEARERGESTDGRKEA